MRLAQFLISCLLGLSLLLIEDMLGLRHYSSPLTPQYMLWTSITIAGAAVFVDLVTRWLGRRRHRPTAQSLSAPHPPAR